MTIYNKPIYVKHEDNESDLFQSSPSTCGARSSFSIHLLTEKIYIMSIHTGPEGGHFVHSD